MSTSTIFRLALASSLLTVALFGQEFRATITGTVTDSSGAAIPRVQVEARNAATSAVVMAQTNEVGAYTIPFLLPGSYTLKATANGFKQAVREGIELHAGDKVQTDLRLDVGAISESVTVAAESEQLRTATASMGQTINTTEARDLPIMGRNTYMLADLATGMYTALNTTSQASGFGRPYDGASAQMSALGATSMIRTTPGRILGIGGGLVLLAAMAVPMISAPGRDALREGFINPPAEARLRCYWWWLNGNTNEATISHDLEEMRAKGYGGAILVDANGSEQQRNRMVPAGPMFGTARWRELYRHALKEAARLELEISLNIESGWNLGGPAVKPEQAAKLLTFSRMTVQGPAEIRRTLPQPPANLGFYRDIAVLAYPLGHGEGWPKRPIRQLALKSAALEFGMSAPKTDSLLEDVPAEAGEQDAGVAEVRDLTGKLSADGSFSWQAPGGTWQILRVGYTASGAKVSTSSGDWQGLAIDYLDRVEFERYWHANLDPLLDDARPYLARRSATWSRIVGSWAASIGRHDSARSFAYGEGTIPCPTCRSRPGAFSTAGRPATDSSTICGGR
jgi:hypothetical protein